MIVSMFAFHCCAGALEIAFPVYLINHYTFNEDMYTHLFFLLNVSFLVTWVTVICGLSAFDLQLSKTLVGCMFTLIIGLLIFISPPMDEDQLIP
eukprot:UN08516